LVAGAIVLVVWLLLREPAPADDMLEHLTTS
jgi:hypothetical protein